MDGIIITDKIPASYCRDKIVVINTNSDRKIRESLSSKNVDILLDPHKRRSIGKINQQDSGLNHVLLKLAKKNRVAIGFSLTEIMEDVRLRPRIFSQIKQNLRLCNKYGVCIVVFLSDTSNSSDVSSLFRVLGSKSVIYVEDYVKSELNFKQRFVVSGVQRVLSKDVLTSKTL
jgi:RNase P/RNase MRP subunit p30